MAKGMYKHGAAGKKENIRKFLKDKEVFMAELNDERGRELSWGKLPTDKESYSDKKSMSKQIKEIKKHGKRKGQTKQPSGNS